MFSGKQHNGHTDNGDRSLRIGQRQVIISGKCSVSFQTSLSINTRHTHKPETRNDESEEVEREKKGVLGHCFFQSAAATTL